MTPITRAYDVCCSYADHPGKSWSTGSDSDTITSHYEHLVKLNSAINGHAANLAVTGAKMSSGPTQAGNLPSDVQYVTILLGANDVCTSSASTMTPTSTFESQFWNTLFNVHWKAPKALVFVSSIPERLPALVDAARQSCGPAGLGRRQDLSVDALRVEHGVAAPDGCDPGEGVQHGAGECLRQCHLQRLLPLGRPRDLQGRVLSSQVSTLDYFHPNASGQAVLANTTWAASYWG